MLKRIITFLIFTLCILTGCTSKNNTVYLDNPKIEKNNLTIEFKAAYKEEKFNITVSFFSLDTNIKTVKLTHYKLTNKETNKDLNILYYPHLNKDKAIELECEVLKKVDFVFDGSLDYFNNEYYFSIRINNIGYRFNIYEQNSENKESYTITYMIDDKEVYKEKRKSNSSMQYEWFSQDYVYYSSKWYFDEKCKELIKEEDKMTSDITVYGKKAATLIYTILFDNSYRVEKANYISNDKEVVIPKMYKKNPVTKFLKETFNNEENKDTIERLYIGKNIIQIPNVNKMVEVKEIHYEGTEAEWNNVYQGAYQGRVVFNSYK